MIKNVLLLVLLSFCASGFAQNETLFVQATKAYNDGNYEKAVSYYEEILKNGKHSAELYFNLGNCHYKLNEIGPSVYYYEKALLLNPNDSEIHNNLGYAQNMRLDAIEQLPETAMGKYYDAVVKLFSFDQWAYIAIALVLLFVLTYILYFALRYAQQKRIMFVTSIAALVLACIALALAYLNWQDFKNENPAIIFDREVVISSAPNDRSEKMFTLHEGTKVNIEARLDDWYKIKIADGQTGWMPVNGLKTLKEFY